MTGQGRRSPRAAGREKPASGSASIEVEAKTPEDAIEEALEKLSIARDEADVEVLDEGKSGFMGIGSKNARVRVSVKGSSEAQQARGDEAGDAEEETVESGDAGAERPHAVEKPRITEPDPAVEAALREILPGLLAPLDPAATVKAIQVRDGRYECDLEIAPDNMAVVLGRRGRTLDAVQTLTAALATRRCDSHVRVILDCGGFREKRREVLVQMAHDAAAEAASSGDEIHLEPMSAHDRKIVHATLSAHDEVETTSEDSGDHRHIVVRVKGSGGSGRSRSRAPRGDRFGGRGGRGGGRNEGRGGRGGGRGHGGRGGQGSGRGGQGGGRGDSRGSFRGRSGGHGSQSAGRGGGRFEERDGNRAQDYMPDESIPDDIGNRAD